jgi:hypothetical protein
MSFLNVIPLIVGFGIGALVLKGNKSWEEVLGVWTNETLIILICYLCWFVL